MDTLANDEWLDNLLNDLEKQYYENNLFEELDEYYTEHPDKLQIIKDIVNNEINWSCRSIDIGIMNDPNLKQHYDNKLNNEYDRKYFDVFRRGNRINYNGLSTTLGQLNFFRWLFVDEIFNL